VIESVSQNLAGSWPDGIVDPPKWHGKR